MREENYKRGANEAGAYEKCSSLNNTSSTQDSIENFKHKVLNTVLKVCAGCLVTVQNIQRRVTERVSRSALTKYTIKSLVYVSKTNIYFGVYRLHGFTHSPLNN